MHSTKFAASGYLTGWFNESLALGKRRFSFGAMDRWGCLAGTGRGVDISADVRRSRPHT